MRNAVILRAAVGAIAAALLPWSVVAPASAVALAKPVISEASITGSQSVTLTGTQTASVTVQMRIVSPDGDLLDEPCLGGDCAVYQRSPGVVLSRGLDTWPSYLRPMSLISGDRRDGVWRAQITMSANDAPRITIDEVEVLVEGTDELGGFTYTGSEVFSNPTISITGIDPPVMEVTTSPADAPATYKGEVTATIRLVQRDSRKVLTGRPLYRCAEYPDCSQPPSSFGLGGLTRGTLRTTDSSGRARFTFPRYSGSEAFFYRVNSGPATDDVMFAAVYMGIPQKYSLSAAVSPTAITLGQTATVQGKVGNRAAVGNRVVVQRWVGGAWASVGSANVRESGRWSYVTKPQGKGTQVYRAWKPSDDCLGGRCAYRGLVSASFGLAVR